MSMNAPPPMMYHKEQAEADGNSARVSSTGKYLGLFTKVKWVTYQSGAAGYLFDFKTDAGQTAERMFVCTVGSNGQPNEIGQRRVAAIMACMGVRSANAQAMKIKEYDYDSQQDVLVDVWGYPDAMNKPIGLVIQIEHYTGEDGKDRFRPAMYAPFNAASGMTAKEGINGGPAEYIDIIVGSLKDKDERKSPEQQAAQQAQQAQGGQGVQGGLAASVAAGALAGAAQGHDPMTGGGIPATPGANADFDDDIPF